jgi:hypothetical protein
MRSAGCNAGDLFAFQKYPSEALSAMSHKTVGSASQVSSFHCLAVHSQTNELTKIRCNRSSLFFLGLSPVYSYGFIFWGLGKGLIIFSGVRLCHCAVVSPLANLGRLVGNVDWRQTEAGWEGESGQTGGFGAPSGPRRVKSKQSGKSHP